MESHFIKSRLSSRTIMLLVIIMTAFSLMSAYAAENQDVKTVRVASDNSGLFLVLDNDCNPVSGYAYEYIETIAAYSGWNVEYVPIESFSDCVDAVIRGDVDIMYDISYSEDRKEYLMYPDMPMGSEEYYLYCMPGNRKIHAMDYASYDGKRVGVTSGTVEVEMLKNWCIEKGISLTFVEYMTVSEKEAALKAGDIELDLEISMLADRDFSALDKISGSSYYLAVNKDRNDILTDINGACAKISSIDRNFFDHLEERYFARSLVSKSLTADEEKWVSEHGTLNVGYMNNYLPFSSTDEDGAVSGIVKDFVPLMFENVGLKDSFEYTFKGFDDNEEMYRALSEGSVDCVFPVFGNLKYALSKNALFSSTVIGISVDLAFADEYLESTTATIAVNQKNQLQDYYTNYYYPEADIVYCDTIDGCLDAVAFGEAGSTILNGMRTVELLSNEKYDSFHTIRLPENAEFSFAVKDGNAALLSIINRALANTDDSTAVTLSYQNLSAAKENVSAAEFFDAHPEYVYGALVLILIFILAFEMFRKDQDRKNEEETRKKQIARMAGGVSSYIVNPHTGRFQILSQNKYLTENYTADEDFSTSISRYIESDVYENDRKSASCGLTLSTMVKALETQDEYIFRFRDNSQGVPRWYEMQAVKLSENEILYGFSDRNNEIISKLILDNLADEYTALYYVNLDTDDYISYHLMQKAEDIRPYYEKNPKFTDLAHDFAISKLVYPDDTESLLQLYPSAKEVKESLKDRKSISVLFRRNYGGRYLWTEISLVKCGDENEEAHDAIVGFIEKDIEVKKRTEQLRSAEESERLLHNLVSSYDAAFTVNMTDDSFVCLRFDDNMIGNVEEFESFVNVKELFLSLLPKSDVRRMANELDYENIKLRLSIEKSYNVEYRRLSNGETQWQLMNITAINDDVIAVGFVDRDLETIKERLEEERYDEYFALFEVDLDTEMLKVVKNLEHYQVVPVGKTVPYEPFIKGIGNKLEGDPRSFYMEISNLDYIRGELATENKRTYSYRSSLLGGGNTWVDVTSYVILRHEDGTPAVFTLGFSLVDALATSSLEMQAQLREAYKQVEEARNAADEANRSKTSFLFNMSHDIRTPMNAITGFTKMAKKHIDEEEKVADYLDKIDTSGQQLLTLINQVLEMARIESGKSELEESPVNIREEYDSAITVLAAQAREKGLNFNHTLKNVIHSRIYADTAKMSSITLNITGNAIKYTPKGGNIDFILEELPTGREGFATFRFTVSDTGIGMSEEYLKVLFDPFTREKSSTVSGIQGTGLGMSIVKELVDMMGGNIEVTSQLGKGTRFDITVDFRIDESKGGKKNIDKSGEETSLEGRRVLLVEDNALNREIAIEILEEEKMTVEDADDGTVAVDKLKEKGPDYYDFILMDIQMPIMGGYEATKVIRNMYPDSHIPIIALSANAFAEDKAASLAAGMDDHVAKPINIKELISALAKF